MCSTAQCFVCPKAEFYYSSFHELCELQYNDVGRLLLQMVLPQAILLTISHRPCVRAVRDQPSRALMLLCLSLRVCMSPSHMHQKRLCISSKSIRRSRTCSFPWSPFFCRNPRPFIIVGCHEHEQNDGGKHVFLASVLSHILSCCCCCMSDEILNQTGWGATQTGSAKYVQRALTCRDRVKHDLTYRRTYTPAFWRCLSSPSRGI